MKKRNLLSLLLSGVMALSCVPQSFAAGTSGRLVSAEEAMNGFGNYPKNYTTFNPNRQQDISLGKETNHDAYNFKVTGKKKNNGSDTTVSLTLLDRDEQGNYLLYAEGSTNAGRYFTQGKEDADGRTKNENVNKYDTKSSDIHFDPTNKTNIAYFLTSNADWNYKHNGVGACVQLPTSIISKIQMREWEIEPETLKKLTDAEIAKLSEEDKAKYEHWVKDENHDVAVRKVTSDIVIPSATELLAYKDKMRSYTANGWEGIMTRTITSGAFVDNDGNLSFSNQFYTFFKDAQRDNNQFIRICDHMGMNNYRVNTMFWVDSDFFKTIKVNLSGLGSEVKKQINQYNVLDLGSLYTDEELKSLGYTAAEINAWAGYGNYPEHTKVTSEMWPGLTSTTNGDFKFKVDGREFVLLDRDSNGNYLVTANEDYGTKEFVSGASTIKTTKPEKANWEYNPENKNSIAYWLDNDFRTNGNGGKKLPQAVLNNIIKKDWKVENSYIVDSTAAGAAVPSGEEATEASKAYTAFKANESNYVSKDIRTINAGIVLMSTAEVKAYHDKLQTPNNGGNNWSTGFALRTTWLKYQYNSAKDQFETWYRNYRVSHLNGGIQLCADSEISLSAGNYRIRPTFWLNKDFFKTNKIETSDLGSEVKKQILQYDMSEMKNLYSNGELFNIGYDVGAEWAGFGNYPEYAELTGTNYETGANPMVSAGASPAENVFYVTDKNGERSFILLDRDRNGNYFVMADEYYGKHKFTTYDHELMKKPYYTEDDETVYNYNDAWHYDPENIDSVAYWLNNEFIQKGNDTKTIPQSMINKMVPYEWKVENVYTVTNESAIKAAHNDKNMTDEDYTAWEIWAGEGNDKGQRTTAAAKLALPSYTEYMAYKDKIAAPEAEWQGAMTRTIHAKAIWENNTLTIKNEFYHILGQKDSQKTAIYNNGDLYNPWGDDMCEYYVRPVFWLESDFFKAVKVNFKEDAQGNKTIGANIANQLKQYTVDELTAVGYTAEELKSLGFKVPYIGEIKVVDGNGNAITTANGQNVIKANISVCPGEEAISRVLILAIYDENNNMKDCDIVSIDMQGNSDEDTFTATISSDTAFGAGYTVKAMLWEDLSGMTPCKYKEI